MILPLLGLAAVALAALVLELKRNERFVDAINFLLFGAVSSVFLVVMREEDKIFFWAILAVVAFNFALSHVQLFRKEYVRVIIAVLSVLVFAFLLKDKAFSFLEQQGILVNKFLVTASVLAVVGYEIGQLKIKLVTRYLGHLDEADTMRALLLFFTGIAVFLSGFQSGTMGLLVVSGMYLTGSFYREGDSKGISVSLLALSVLSFLAHRAGKEGADLLDGDVLEGLFFGGFGMYFIQKLFTAERRNVFFITLGYAITLLLACGILYLSLTYERMGGMDAFIGVLIGFALTNAMVGKGMLEQVCFLFYLS